MRQLRCIATYSRRLGAPKTSAILNRSTLQHDTITVVLTEFTSASINHNWLNSRQQDWLHCLTRLTDRHQHSHVLSTHARAHALWCAVKRDSHTIILLTYLTRFCVMTLTFDLITFNVCSASAFTWPNHAHVASPIKLSLRHNWHNRYTKIGRQVIWHRPRLRPFHIAL